MMNNEVTTTFDMVQTFIQQNYGYSEKRAAAMATKLSAHEEILEEFANYMSSGSFAKKDNSKTEICGYTAEKLHNEFKLSPLGAYNFLVYLKEEPENALADLKAGLPRK